MAGKATPWWRDVLTRAMRGLRAGVAALRKTARKTEEPAALVRTENKLTDHSPQATPLSVPEIEPVVKPPAEIAEEIPPVSPEGGNETEISRQDSVEPAETPAASDPEAPEIELVEAASEAAAESIREPSDEQPAVTGQAVEETIVTPEVETEATAKEPDLEAAVEILGEEEAGAPEPRAIEPQQLEASPGQFSVEAPNQSEGTTAPSQREAASAAQEAKPEAPPAAPQAVKREAGPDTSPVSVIVSQVYEGPFDLLLDLIRKQDIDIYNIPIAKITAQFLAYVNQLRAGDMDVAGEFIYTASLLIHIKSKMLLPREPTGLDDAQEDPRRELVERLLEHERFKNAAQMLGQKQMLEAATWTNPGMREFREDAGAEAEIAANTTDLVRVFREILERARNRPIIDVEEDAVTVGQMIQFLGRRLTMEDKPVALRRLLAHTKSERALIAMFLALLELVRMQAILLRQDRHFSEIFIKKNAGFEAVMNQGLATDDWK